MAFCIQCGETLTLEAKTCPSCGRLVGMPTIGPALERQVHPGTKRAARVVGALLVVGLLAFAASRLLRHDALAPAELDAGARLAAPSLVRVSSERSAGGVVIRKVGATLLVATLASKVPRGAEVLVTSDAGRASGCVLFTGRSDPLADFSLDVVPRADPLLVSEAHIGAKPAVDDVVVALTESGKVAGGGRILSFEDGPGAGTLVHDAELTVADRGFGLFTSAGRFAALTTFERERGENLGLAATSLMERLLVHEVVAGPRAWAEHSLPISKGMVVGLFSETPIEARLGPGGEVAKLRKCTAQGYSAALDATSSAPLQLRGGALDARVLVVTLAAP